MEYLILCIVIIWFFCRAKNRDGGEKYINGCYVKFDDSWKEIKKRRRKSLKDLKKIFRPAPDNEKALEVALETLAEFHKNHGQSVSEIEEFVKSLNLPDDLIKLEAALRREINNFYKERNDLKSKAIAVHLSYQHAKLQLQNPDNDWKKFSGLQKLQSNWKAEEYFNGLLVLMTAFNNTFPKSNNLEKLSSDIERMFELWNSMSIARKNFEALVENYNVDGTISDRHFNLYGIIEYLYRRYKFNPSYKDELINWCLKDIELYEDFLKHLYVRDLFSLEQLIPFHDNPKLEEKKLKTVNFDQVKEFKYYSVPRLNSYDVLDEIYRTDKNEEKLRWLTDIGVYIGYIKDDNVIPQQIQSEASESGGNEETLDLMAITREIEILKSGQKGKLAFLNSKGEPCSTESAYKDFMEQKRWYVMRAEVTFWQSMFCLTFWDEIFNGVGRPSEFQDIPHDLFNGEEFYKNRSRSIDYRYEQVKTANLFDFINRQIKKSEGTFTRLLYNGDLDMLSYAKSDIVQNFVQRIDPEIFAKIVYRIAQNPCDNRAGVSDFVIWNDFELKMVEIKKGREKLRESQLNWISWMIHEGIPTEIVRVKPVKSIPGEQSKQKVAS